MTLFKVFLNALKHSTLHDHFAGLPVVVGVSGGADSLCLLHLLNRAANELDMRLHVATLDHGIRDAESMADASFVEHLARQWKLPVHREYRDVSSLAEQHQLGIEEAARLARYTFLTTIASEIGAPTITVGHNADDQAETILMHLIRGSGLAGLRGMRQVTHLGVHHVLPGAPAPRGVALLRPLLNTPRADIEAYCTSHKLQPREDSTNVDTRYQRNRLRHEIMPLLAQINPNIRQTLVRTARIINDDYTKLSQLVRAATDRITVRDSNEVIVLDLEAFRQESLGLAVQRGILRRAGRRLSPASAEIGFETVEQALQVALDGTTGKQATLPGGTIVRVEYDTLIICRPQAGLSRREWPALPSSTVLDVAIPGTTPLPDSQWVLHARQIVHGEDPSTFFELPLTAVLAIPADVRVTLRTRREGDRFAPLGQNGHTQKLKKTLNDARVPAGQRDTLPFLLVDDQIAWLPLETHSRIAEPFAVREPAQRTFVLSWTQLEA
jgi:tRNA(Ile)-lysidine synthase